LKSIKTTHNLKPYEKPVVRVIELNADEVMALGCKTNGTATKALGNNFPIGTCYLPRKCLAVGS
jgi:hypothetical protein